MLLRPRLSHLPMTEGEVERLPGDPVPILFRYRCRSMSFIVIGIRFPTALFLVPRKKQPVRTEAAGLGGKAYMKLTVLKTFSLGPFHFRQIPTYIFDGSYDVTSYPMLGGLIGNDLLRRFNVILNYEHSEIYLIPNSSFNQPFDYSYSEKYPDWAHRGQDRGDRCDGKLARRRKPGSTKAMWSYRSTGIRVRTCRTTRGTVADDRPESKSTGPSRRWYRVTLAKSEKHLIKFRL